MSEFRVIVVGASWGGLHALSRLLEGLRGLSDVAIVIAQHRHADSGEMLGDLLQARTDLDVQEVDDKDRLDPGRVYLAPPEYHVLIEREGTLALSVDERVHYARPSIDVLFESAADAYGERCIGIVLTGANDDGAAGLRRIKDLGGLAIVQDPRDSERPEMPAAALAATDADVVLPIDEIAAFVQRLLAPATERSAT